MRVDEERGCVVFDHLVDIRRELGSVETISMQKPAKKAVATNAKGVFEDKSLYDINQSATSNAKRVTEALLSA